MKESLVKEVLFWLVREYQKHHRSSVSGLSSHRFSYLDLVAIGEKSKLSRELDSNPEIIGEVIDELAARGYVEKDFHEFTLTEEGFREGSSGQLKRVLWFLNRNPGLSILVGIIGAAAATGTLIWNLTK
ncbi:hypothetical protein [Microbulbifer litoralis]|uniref:hypothetical protein n=1 Tax=Microbulbifer litoralis TaxID=2933965 RepID=UPI002027F687|nr:hypothetical protein [Microbulbifer sp. GX H0434]